MNIVQVSPYSLARNGGVQKHVRDLAAEFRKLGHNVLAIGPGSGTPAPEGTVNIGAMRPISFAGTHFELARATKAELKELDTALQSFKPDIIHYHTMWTPLLPFQVFRRTRQIPSYATFHDTTTPDTTGAVLRAVFRPLSRALLNRLDGACTVSTAPLQHLRHGPRGVAPIILPPATNLAPYFAVNKPRHHGRPVVLFVGRLEPRKGITVLLEAWRQIIAASAETCAPHLIIAGHGECTAEVAATRQALGETTITHLERVDDASLQRLFAFATIAVSPALYGESFGIVLCEALASGTPVVAAANAGYKHVMTGPGEDLLVEPGNATALASRIMELLSDPARCRTLGNWGREHVRQFDVKACAPQFISAYEQAIARHNST